MLQVVQRDAEVVGTIIDVGPDVGADHLATRRPMGNEIAEQFAHPLPAQIIVHDRLVISPQREPAEHVYAQDKAGAGW